MITRIDLNIIVYTFFEHIPKTDASHDHPHRPTLTLRNWRASAKFLMPILSFETFAQLDKNHPYE